ncbi:MAG: helix-turn-helix domain-containing protein [Desulfovibrio sp.]|uniref:helix-turn-helix domain-containing protein n=1 Tax=Desulfovibrio sp. TaxID=885 RepID=UPI001A7C3158|nr:helix-turn-helix domain-containing protein [Desulfovibrio sp.]MBD5417074.1 helix-turn-helix domain-containing protein [Desulfovibrio sp.]
MSPLTENEKAQRPLDVLEAAEFLKIGRSTMFKLITSGEVKAKKVGRQWRVTIEALNEYLNKSDN